MTKDGLHDLIQRDLDGDLAEAERKRLQEGLRRSVAARREHEEFRALSSMLGSMEEVEPPAQLADHIRAAVRGEDATVGPVRSLLNRIRSTLQERRRSVQFSVAFAGGLMAGVILFAVLGGPLKNWYVADSDATGSLAVQLGTIPITGEGVQGTVNVARTPTGRELTLNVISRSPAAVRLSYNAAEVTIASIKEIATSGGEMTIRPGLVQMDHSTLTHCAISFSTRGEADVQLVVAPASGRAFQTTIPIRR
jgi:anti-sigma factor RsiW